MHLGPHEFIDLAEGVRAEIDAPHLLACPACRRQLADVRAALSELSSASQCADVPEPSPLFWDHFSERVREAVSAEGSPRPRDRWAMLGGWIRPRRPNAVPLAGALAMIAAAVALTSYVVGSRVPNPASENGSAAVESLTGVASLLPLGSADDPTLLLVADLAADLDLDAAGEAGLTVPAHAGGADDVVSTLTGNERRELQRLLQEALATPHA